MVGFSPIPAMSMISFAAGTRYLSLIGATSLSFYDWYCDLPPSSPQTWGEQTDVPESADWWNSSYIIVAGTNIPMTRTPDAHFYSEARYNGTKVVAVSPDYSEYVKFADLWMPAKAGTDAALFLAMGHVVLKEFFIEREEPYFIDYGRRFTDLPMLVMLRPLDGARYAHDRFLRASDFGDALGESENAEWKPVSWDEIHREPVVPAGSIGHRWQKEPGRWNLRPVDSRTREIRPALSGHEPGAGTVTVAFPEFSRGDARAHRLARYRSGRRSARSASPPRPGAGSESHRETGRARRFTPASAGVPVRCSRARTRTAGTRHRNPGRMPTQPDASPQEQPANERAPYHCTGKQGQRHRGAAIVLGALGQTVVFERNAVHQRLDAGIQ